MLSPVRFGALYTISPFPRSEGATLPAMGTIFREKAPDLLARFEAFGQYLDRETRCYSANSVDKGLQQLHRLATDRVDTFHKLPSIELTSNNRETNFHLWTGPGMTDLDTVLLPWLEGVLPKEYYFNLQSNPKQKPDDSKCVVLWDMQNGTMVSE